MTHHADIRRPQASAAGREESAAANAEHIVRRVLLRHGFCTEAKDVRRVAGAVLASASPVVLRVLGQGFCAEVEAEEAGLVADAIMAAAYLAGPAAGSPQSNPGRR